MNDLYLRAARGERTERPPIWIMRQAGRYLPEYRATRARAGNFIALCKSPELAAEVTLQPIDILGVDAAILFSDILIPIEPMGFAMTFDPSPVLDPPVRSRGDVDRLRVPEPEQVVPFVYETIAILRRELAGRVPLIGFGGAPLTLAAYMVEGQGSKSFDRLKRLLYGDPASAHALLDKTTTLMERYLAAQVRAGAQALQIFDTWAGILSEPDYREFALRYVRRLTDALRPLGVPLTYFAVDAAHLFGAIAESGADVIGVDWRTSLAEASRRLGDRFVLQGNLDPSVLLASRDVVRERAQRAIDEGRQAKAHIFNLGHGILPDTPVENAKALVAAVKGFSSPG